MKKYNSYLIDASKDNFKVLFEIIDNNSDGIINYYYELNLKLAPEKGGYKFDKLVSYKEINNPLEYIYLKFNDRDIEEFRLSDNMSNHILKHFSKKVYEDSHKTIYNSSINDLYKLKKQLSSSFILHDTTFKPINNSVIIRNLDLLSKKTNSIENEYDKKYSEYKETIKRLKRNKKH